LLRLPIWLYRLGFGELVNAFHIMVLTTRGRKSGVPRHTAIEYRAHGSKTYIVSAWGERPNWYQNLVENPIVSLRQGQRRLVARAEVIEDRAEVLRALYLFRKTAPVIYDVVLARLSNENAVNRKNLPDVSHEFTVVRLDPATDVQGLPAVTDDWRRIWLCAVLAGIFAAVLIRLVGNRHD
jgi:deazaflavin-dependent oxidoreductase (nitroreductase family)